MTLSPLSQINKLTEAIYEFVCVWGGGNLKLMSNETQTATGVTDLYHQSSEAVQRAHKLRVQDSANTT